MRKTLIQFISFLLLSATAYSQPAPDFTVTDTEGQVHQLYNDYLNQGKTVMIKIFFTTCPPCNSIAPLMEPFYQEWGAGEYDVEFFEITDKNFDTDALVEAYAINYGETFPAISVDGGALTAVQPYKNGMFGPWFGTPTFIVIAPDGSVQYNVDGAGNQATINAIDAAIAATGAVKPGQGETPVTVTGQVQYLSGSTGVGNAYVQVSDANGNILQQDTTDINGAFNLDIFLSEVQPGWQLGVKKAGIPLNGVNALDLVRIQKHILSVQPFDDELAKIASNANFAGSINTLDVVTILKVLLGITTEFPNGQNWVIFPADTEFGPPTQQPPVIPSYTIPLQDILDGLREPVFTAVKVGDPTGNANPNQ